MADVRTGKLDQRIDIYEIQKVKNEFGTIVTTRVLYRSTWAKIEYIRGKKSLESQQEVMKDAYKITVRYRPDLPVNKNLQIDYKGRVLNLVSIIDDRAHKLFTEFWGHYSDADG